MKKPLLILGLLLGTLSAWGQNTLIYTGTFTSPYDSGTQITLNLYGNPGDMAQEHVNYTYQGPSASEVNTVRIDFSSTLRATWSISGSASPPTVQQVYQTLTGTTVSSLPTTPLSYTTTLSQGAGSQTVASSASTQSGSWDFGSPWSSSSSGVWWATFGDATNLGPVFTYDGGLATPKLSTSNGTYLQTKTVQLELVKNNPLNMHLNQQTLSGSTLSTTLTSMAGSSSTQPSWQTLNLWVNGVLQASTALTKGTATAANGVRSDPLSWAYSSGKTYQLQAVDALGNSQSVWYPKREYRFDSLGKVARISGGYEHSLILKSDGTVWAWGANYSGQLGNNSTTNSSVPVQVSNLAGVVAVSGGVGHSLALKSDGTVWAWGDNEYGDLGVNSTTESNVPVQVNGLTGVIAIATGWYDSVALKSDGTVWAWGNNGNGQLGNNSTTRSLVPVQVNGLSGVAAIVASTGNVLALKSDGTLWGWGYNGEGNLGNNSTNDAHLPVRVGDLTEVTMIAAGSGQSLALKSDGTVWAWGNNSRGQLGNNSTTNSSVPVRVTSLSEVVAVTAGGADSFALKSDGTVWAWGNNANGELGTNSTTNSSAPVQVNNLTGVIAIDGGSWHTLALKSDGSIWTWGENDYGQLGNNSTTQSNVPVRTLGLVSYSSIAAGESHSLALKSDGSVWTWGGNSQGQLGTNTTLDSDVPVAVSSLTGAVSLAAGSHHTVAVKSDGTAWTWGDNSNGQLGNNTAVDSKVPVQAGTLTGAVQAAAGSGHSVIVKNDGTVWAWGYNGNGQLGNNSTTDSHVPVQVSGLTGAVWVAAGAFHSAAVKSDGTVWTWGANFNGQLGNSTASDSHVPVQVTGLAGASLVTAGAFHTAAVKFDGTVWTWGSNSNGQLGNGTTNDSPAPVQVVGLTGVVAIAAGDWYTVALKSDGTVWSWGSNLHGQLGTSGGDSLVPVQMAGLTNVVALAAGGGHSVVLKADGTVWTWGDNGNGQLGNGTTNDSFVPVPVSLPNLQYDTAAPALSVTQTPSGWTNQQVTLTLTATTATGIDETTVAYNTGSSWTNGSQVTVSANGTVQFRASDLGGRQATISVNVTNIDTVAPTFTVTSPASTADQTWTASGVTLTDSLSGIHSAACTYLIDGNPQWSGTFTINAGAISIPTATVPTGSHTSVLTATDNAGNITQRTFSFAVNRAGPTITATTPVFAGTSWMATNVSITDTVSGVNPASYQYTFDGVISAAFTVTNGTITLDVSALGEGLHTVVLTAANNAGYSSTASYSFTVDRTGPSITAAVSQWTSSDLKVTGVGFVDGGSGVNSASAVWWLDSTTPSSTNPIVLTAGTLVVPTSTLAEGSHTLYLSVSDNLGNITVVPFGFSYDHTPPSLTATVPSVCTTALNVSNVVLTDSGSGPNWASLVYWFDTASAPASPRSLTLTSGASPIDVSGLAMSSHVLYLRGADNAGNLVQAAYPFAISLVAQKVLLYTGTFVSPYDSGTEVTLQLWGNPGDKAQEKVNYRFQGGSANEVNTVRIDFQSTLSATWTITGSPNPPTIQQVYQNLTGTEAVLPPNPALSYTTRLDLSDGSSAFPVTSANTAQSGSWDFGTPWASSSSGVWWATFSAKTNLGDMFSYDNGLATPQLSTSNGTYLANKFVQLELVKNNPLNVHVNQPTLTGSTLSTTLSSLASSSSTQPSWQTLNLWVNGVLQASTALTKGNSTATNGVRNDPLTWSYTAGKTYQLQAVDALGNSQSVWFPKQSYRFDPGNRVLSVSGGEYHSLALGADGTVWAWGENNFGQLGNNSTTNSLVPVRVGALTGAIATAAFGRHSMALKSDGTVWTWGNNSHGQLGNNTLTNSSVPVQVKSLTGVIAIAAGSEFSLALRSDGTVWAWGSNSNGQLGDNTNSDRTVPVPVSNLAGVIAIAGGAWHSVALKSNGTVWAWGSNDTNQLGNNSTVQSPFPVQVNGLTGMTAIAAGWEHSLALKSDGTVWSWGFNGNGQLGNNTKNTSPVPIPVNGITSVTAIAAGYFHSMTLKADGTVWAWGLGNNGQLGSASVQSLVPIQVLGLTGVRGISGGHYHTLALESNCTVWALGYNSTGQLGNNSTANSNVPVMTLGLNPTPPIAAGESHTLAQKSDGTVWGWGSNSQGQLGNNTTLDSDVPVAVSSLSGAVSLAAGAHHTVTVKSDGTVWSWGDNSNGQLGNSTVVDSKVPVQAGTLTGAVQAAAGAGHSVVVKNDGTVWSWGYNGNGQLGNNTTTDSKVPIQVTAVTGAVSIGAGAFHTAAAKSDGTVWTWGANFNGQLGNNSAVDSHVPVQVTGLTGVFFVAAGAFHTVALKSDGTVWTWGSNSNGQLGNGTTTDSAVPVQVAGLTGVIAIAAGDSYTVALKSDGTIWSWGCNASGQLGNAGGDSAVPVQMAGLTNVVAVAAGGGHTVVLKADGKVWAWGGNSNGQLGNGTTNDSFVPVPVSLPNLQYDTAAPVLSVTQTPSGWTNQPVTLTMTATTATGIDETTVAYSTGSGWTSGSQVTVSANGTVQFRASDLGGRQAATSVNVTNIDTVAPTFTVTSPASTADQTWTASGVTLTDDLSGLNSSACTYIIDGNSQWSGTFTVNGGTLTISMTSNDLLHPQLLPDGSHSIVLTATDNAGNITQRTFSFTVDRAGPTILVTAPGVAGAFWTATNVSINDTLSGVNTASYQYAFDGGIPALFAVTNGTIVLDSSALAEGSHTVVLTAANNAGYSSTASYTFTVDRTGPTITATVPAATNAAFLNIQGLSVIDNGAGADKTSYVWWLDSSTRPSSPSPMPFTSGSGTLPLGSIADGAHRFYLSAADKVGNISIAWFPFSVDRTAPGLTAAVPTFTKDPLNIIVAFTEPDGTSNIVWWLDSSAPPTSPPPSALGMTSGPASILLAGAAEGVHTLYLMGTDSAGNTTTVSYPFTLDLTPPAIAATVAPYANSTLALTGVSFTDALSGPSGPLSYWFDTVSAPSNPGILTVSGGNASIGMVDLTTNKTLADGHHTLYLSGSDAAGNPTKVSFPFTVDQAAPSLVATFSQYVSANGILAGTVNASDAAGVTGVVYTIDGSVAGTISSNGAVSLAIPSSLSEGIHSLGITVTDTAGNSFTGGPYGFTLDRTPPVLTAQTDAWANATVGVSGLVVTDSGSGPATGVTYWLDGNAAASLPLAVSGGKGSIAVSSLGEGAHSVTLQAADNAGNRVTQTTAFTVTRQNPVLVDAGLTENGTLVGAADYLQGGTDLVSPQFTDAAPVRFRLAANQSGTAPQNDSGWLVGTHADWTSAPVDVSSWFPSSVPSYLYVQALDAAGNLSAVTERVIRVDSGAPGTTSIRSTTFPYAHSPRDAVAQTVGIFQFSVSSTGPGGLKNYEWALYQTAATPTPGTDVVLQSGTGATGLTLPGLADTQTNLYYWLAVRAVGGNGKPGAWAFYPFAVNTTPPRDLTVTSSTHPLPSVAYQGIQASFEWNQPADFNGVKSYAYRYWVLPLGVSDTPDKAWTGTTQSSFVVQGLSGSGTIVVQVTAADWSGNTASASYTVTFDNTAPVWDPADTAHTVSVVPDPATRTAVLNWRNAVDDISSVDKGLVYGVQLEDITSQPYTETLHWQYLSALPASMQTTFDGLVVGHSYLATVVAIDGAGNPLAVPLAFQETDPGSQVLPSYDVAYSLNFGGLMVAGTTTYSEAAITAQTAALTLAGTPLSAPAATVPVTSWPLPQLSPAAPSWQSVPRSAADPDAVLAWSGSGVAGPVHGLTLDFNGLKLGTLTLTLPLTDLQGHVGIGVPFGNVSIGPSPEFAFVSSDQEAIPAGATMAAAGWNLNALQGASLAGQGWILGSAQADVSDGRFSVSSDAAGTQPALLPLAGAQMSGQSVAMGPVAVPSSGLYVTSGGLTIRVVHATVEGRQLVIAQGYAQVAGLGPTDLELEDVIIDTNGQFVEGAAFASHLTASIMTPYGTLSAGTNAFVFTGGQLTLSQAVLTRADGSTVALTGAVFDSSGMTSQGGSVSGAFEGLYFGFPVHASGGTIVGGTRVFDNATMDLPAFGLSGVPLPGLGISLASDALTLAATAPAALSPTTAYGSGVTASSLTLSPSGVTAELSVVLPPSWGGAALSLGSRTLSSSGAVGAGSGIFPAVTYKGFPLQPVSASLGTNGLRMDLTLTGYAPIDGTVMFSALALKADGTVAQAGTSAGVTDQVHYVNASNQTVDWRLAFPSLRVDAQGIDGEPTIALPAALGGTDYQLGTTTLQSDGSVTTQASGTAVQMTVFGWTTSAASLSLDGPNFVLNSSTVLLPGLMQGNDIPVGQVQVDPQGTLVSTDQAQPTVFRGTNGFQVAATNVRFDPRGLVMGGQVQLPAVLGGASVSFPDGTLYLEPDGALLGESDTGVTLTFGGFSVSAARAVLDRTGLTVSGGTVTPLGLAAIPLPDFTVYSTGELAVAGQSLSSGSFSLPGGIAVAYSGVRFSDQGLSLSASVSLPPTWGGYQLSFDDITVSPDGHLSSSASLQNLVIPLDAIGVTATIGTLRLADDGFHIDDVQFQFNQGDLASQPLSVGSARIGFDGSLDLYGFSFTPISLYGYQVTLSSLSVSTTGIGLSGGITLSNSIPIPELQGLYIPITKFDIGFDGSVKHFEVSLDQGFSMTVFNSWTVGIQGFTVSKNLLTVNQATLDLPASFNLPQLQVSGLSIDLASGQITWGQIAVSGISYQWNGLNFQLNKLQIDPTNGLIFAGTVDIPATASNGTPYPALLAGRTLVVDSLQILPTGLPGTISASLTGINGPLFDDNVLLSNAGIGLSNAGGSLVFSFTGGLKLGASFPSGLAGVTLNIQSLSVNVSDGTFGTLAAQASAADGLGTLTMAGGMAFVPQSIGLAQTSGNGFEVDVSGVFQTNAAFPGALANLSVPIEAFRMDSSGHLLELKASTAIPDSSALSGGLTLSGATLGVAYPGPDGGVDFTLSGSIVLGPAFLDGLSGTTLNVRSLVWAGSGALVSLDAGTSWSGSKTLFGAASVQDGSISVAGSGTAPWTISLGGTLKLPDSLPQGLAGLSITIGSLVFQTDGTIKDANIATSPLNLNLFGAAQLNNASLRFSKYDAHALRIDVDGASLSLPAVMGTGLGGLTANINHFAMTTAGTVLAFDGSVPLAPSIPLFAGVTISQSQLGFSSQGVEVSGTLTLPSSMLQGTPDLAVQRALFGWNGKLLDLAAGLAHATVQLGGFTTDITNLAVSTSGVTLQSAVLTLPPDLGSRQISIVNAGFTTSGQFTGTVGVNEIDQTIAGFGLQMTNITFDVSSRVINVATARLQTPNIGSLSGYVQLNAVAIGPSGMSLGGVGFSLPDFNYGGVGFRSVHVSFSISGSTYFIAGGGQATITGLGTLDAELSFTNVSSTYPIGLQRAYFQYTMTPGIPLGTTGLYLNQIRGGFAYGPPNELPSTLRPLFDNTGPRLQLGVGVSTALGSGVLQMDANFWIDIHNAAWAFDGNATVLSGLTTGDLQAGYGNSIFYGSFSFEMVFVDGKVQIWIFPYHGSTVLSGEGDLEFVLHTGALLHWHIDLGWFGSYDVNIPTSTARFGGISAEFGQFNRGVGVEGSIDVPCWGSVGAFVDGGGIHFNTSDYSLIKPAGY